MESSRFVCFTVKRQVCISPSFVWVVSCSGSQLRSDTASDKYTVAIRKQYNANAILTMLIHQLFVEVRSEALYRCFSLSKGLL